MHIFALRQCTDFVRVSYVYAGAGEARVVRAMFAAGWPRRSWSCLMFVVSKPRWPCRTIIPDLHLHWQRTLLSAHLSEPSLSECVRLCDAHKAYTYGM